MTNCIITKAGERTQKIEVNNPRTGRYQKWESDIYLLLAHLKTHRVAVHGDRFLEPVKVRANGRPVEIKIEVREPHQHNPYRSAVVIASQDGIELARYE